MKKQKKGPVYLQIYMQLREQIVKGSYKKGVKLPSKRVLAANFGVSIITVEHAYALLCDEGYIEPRERSGYFVIFKKEDGFALPEEKREGFHLEEHLEEIKEEEIRETKFPFSVLAKTMRSVITELGEDVFTLSLGKGCMELRKAISRYLARSRGIRALADQIVIGSGSEYLYRMICDLFGRDVIYGIESPSYQKIEQVYSTAGVTIEKIPLTKEGLDSRYLHESKAGVLHISPYRSYPSRVTANASKRYEYIQWAQKEGRYLVEDDFESEFSVSRKVEETLFSLSGEENVIYMNSFSMTIDPSLRVAYMVLPPSLLKQYEERLGFYSCTVPTYIQFVLAKLIDNGDFERHINRVRRQKRKGG